MHANSSCHRGSVLVLHCVHKAKSIVIETSFRPQRYVLYMYVNVNYIFHDITNGTFLELFLDFLICFYQFMNPKPCI